MQSLGVILHRALIPGDPFCLIAMQEKTGDERSEDGQRKRASAIEPVPIHQTATLPPLKVIEIKNRRWWQFWR